LHVTIRETREIVFASDGNPYIRRGAQSLPINRREALERLRRNKGTTSFETATLVVPLDAVSNSVVIIEFMLEVVPSAEPLPWLKKQLLVAQGDHTALDAAIDACLARTERTLYGPGEPMAGQAGGGGLLPRTSPRSCS
jgi:hypothetical protein